MSDLKHIETTEGYLNELRTIEYPETRSIQLPRMKKILRPSKIAG